MIQTNNASLEIYIKQESVWRVCIRALCNSHFLKAFIFSNIIQLLPVWIMITIHLASVCAFGIEEYISNLLTFIIISCAVNLTDLYKEKESRADAPPALVTNLSFIILIFSLILYCLWLINYTKNLGIKTLNYYIITIALCIIVMFINFWKESKK